MWIFILASIGMSHILVESRVLHWFREKIKEWFGKDGLMYYMVNCYQCTGFWAGFLLSLLFWIYSGITHFECLQCFCMHTGLTGMPILLDQIIFGCITSFASLLSASLIVFLDVPRS